MLGPYAVVNCLSRCEAERWRKKMAAATDMGRGGIQGSNSVDLETRTSWVGWPDHDLFAPLFFQVTEAIRDANRRNWGIHLDGYAEWQLTRYDAGESGHYHTHVDTDWSRGLASCRKVSASLLLSPGEAFEGGDLELVHVGGPSREDVRSVGKLVVFPSIVPHRVSPVTKGTRWSLVTWQWGRNWR